MWCTGAPSSRKRVVPSTIVPAGTERVHSRAQLLDQVWGDQVYIEARTVDVHIRRLRLALEPFGQDALIETVRGSGYRLAAPTAR